MSTRIVITLLLTTCLTACGQKGALYLPDKKPVPATQPIPPAPPSDAVPNTTPPARS